MGEVEFSFIKSLAMMGNLSDQTLEQLSSELIKRSYRKGNFVFSQGEVVDHLYFVEKGKMEIFKSDANGKKLTLWFVEAGDVFCLANMYAEHSFANACCAEDTRLYCLAKKKLGEILASNNELSMQFIQCMSRKLAVYSELIDDFAFLKMTARVAKTILISQRLDEQNRAACSLSQGEIASMLGTCREVVARIVKKLKEEGAIDSEAKGKGTLIIVTNPDKLQEISESS